MSEAMPKCPKCGTSDQVSKGTVPKTKAPPGHIVLSILVGAVKLAHKAGIVNFYGHYCGRCKESFG